MYSWIYSLGYKLIRIGCVIHFLLVKDTHLVWLDVLTRSVNNLINIFLINPIIILYHVF